MVETKKPTQEPPQTTYTMRDVMKITDEIFNLSKEKGYHPGAFVHSLIFTLEITQQSYNIPQQQLAEIKRDCRRYVHELATIKQEGKPSSPPPK